MPGSEQLRGERLRIALVFPPPMFPMSPPLGIASLKAYLDQGNDFSVRNFDLNLTYCEQAFEWLAAGRLRVAIKGMDQNSTAEQASTAREFFLGGNGLGRFFDPREYELHARVYSGFGSVVNGLFDNFSRRILLGLPVPPLVRRFFEELIEPVKSFKPDLVGFSILFSQQLLFALALAKLCRESGMKTVFGGATFSVMPDPGRLLAGPVPVSAGKECGDLEPGGIIDYMMVGEGEIGLQKLAETLANGKSQLSGVPGLIRLEGGSLQMNPPEAIQDLNSLPSPDFSDFELRRYHSPLPVLPYLSSRGCPWRRCAFCTHQKTYLDYREESAEHTARRLAAMGEKHGVSHFSLVDEMIHPHRLRGISSALNERGSKLFYSAYARPERFGLDTLRQGYESGLRLVMWGVEAGSRRVLDLMRKGTRIENMEGILKDAHSCGIWNLLFVLFGFPTETGAEMRSTVDLLERLGDSVDAVSKSLFVLLEGSNVFNEPAKYRISKILDRPQRGPVSVAYDYEVEVGLSQREAAALFSELAPRFADIGRSPWFGQFREHMLLFASNGGVRKRN